MAELPAIVYYNSKKMSLKAYFLSIAAILVISLPLSTQDLDCAEKLLIHPLHVKFQHDADYIIAFKRDSSRRLNSQAEVSVLGYSEGGTSQLKLFQERIQELSSASALRPCLEAIIDDANGLAFLLSVRYATDHGKYRPNVCGDVERDLLEYHSGDGVMFYSLGFVRRQVMH